MGNWSNTTDESRKRWEENAQYWDERMGEHSNRFHREIIRPATEKLLALSPGERVLDIACGNGNFSRRMAEMGVTVTAFDYSARLVERARERCSEYLDKISFKVVDATKFEDVICLGEAGSFDKAAANMALMDISDIEPLLGALHTLLKPGGIFVFSVNHPCFQTRRKRSIVETEDIGIRLDTRHGILLFEYITPSTYEGLALSKQPVPQFYYHRPLSQLFSMCFKAGFVLDGLEEPVFEDEAGKSELAEIPPALIVRLRKLQCI